MKIYSFTFARSGSKGIKNKNLKIFNKKPLVHWAIKDALKSKLINKIFISTDSKKIANVANKAGAIIPFLRPKKLSTSNSPEYLSWRHAIKFLKEKNDLPDIFLSVPCTSPLRTSNDLDNMIRLFVKERADFVVGIYESDRSPYFNLMKIKNNKLEVFSKRKKNIFRRQDCPKTYNLSTFAFIAKPDYILSNINFYSGKAKGYIIDKKRSIDIDELMDLEYAEYLRKKYAIKK